MGTWSCESCGYPLPADRDLFCSEVCSDFARNVRYHRRVIADGRIERPDVKAAVEVRMAYAIWGQAPERPLRQEVRQSVFAAKGDRCVRCGAAATDIDHIESAYHGDDSLANLQPLCHGCHLEKTLASPVPWATSSSADDAAVRVRRNQEYLRRVHAPEPFRRCDDAVTWPSTWQTIRAERARQRLTHELRSRLRALHRAGGSSTVDDLLADVLSGLGVKHRRAMEALLLESIRAAADDADATARRPPTEQLSPPTAT